jgi:ribosome-associated toxin RatA of RatAB toxin-antitoxin module
MTHLLRALLVAAVVAGPVAVAGEADPLDRGEISVRTHAVEGSGFPRVVVQGVIDAAPERVWAIVSNCNGYEGTMPRIRAAREVERNGDTVICEITVALPFPMSDLTARTRATHVEGPPRWSRSWTLIEGDYDVNDGSWILEPYKGDPGRTLATYSVHAEPHTSVPGWARRRAQTSSMPDIIEHLRAALR